MAVGVSTFLRYIISGCVALGVHLLVLSALVELLSVDEVLASAVGFVVACAVNFCVQFYYVFGASDQMGQRATRYAAITIMTLLLNTLLFAGLFEITQFHYSIVQGITTAIIFVVNYVLNALWTFSSGTLEGQSRRHEP